MCEIKNRVSNYIDSSPQTHTSITNYESYSPDIHCHSVIDYVLSLSIIIIFVQFL